MQTTAFATTLHLATLDVDAQEADRVSSRPLRFSAPRVMRELWNEIRLRDSGITREHWVVLLRTGAAMLSLGLLVLLVICVRVMNDGLEVDSRANERNIRIVQKEHDRLELEAQARRAPQQIDAAILALGLVHSPTYELTDDGHAVLVSAPLTARPPAALAPTVAPKPAAGSNAVSTPASAAPVTGSSLAGASNVSHASVSTHIAADVVAQRGEIGSTR
jgi:hypothetical protein